ncbi:hypothetical protein [Metapseudomonas boanensis]|uniref:Uncharacterized protein n=1 Tax=Metapseudomonas boanensis TaxID=2822138 RepID=A0ABS5XDT2_9GAMM|nr:hypothetical protein [Pseudomonas boanensis]MBT8765829.1 hypothetical protein [Pseudomonas boanensis]
MLSLQEPARTPSPVLASLREDHWHPRTTTLQAREVRFTILAESEPDILSRLLGYFAQLQLVPRWLEATQQGDTLRLQLLQQGLTPHRAEVIAQKMRSLVSVDAVTLEVLPG